VNVKNTQSTKENTETCCTNTTIKELTAQEIGIPNLNVKIFEMHPNGYSPLHQHTEKHRLFITNGQGKIFNGQKDTRIQTGDVIYFEPHEPHQLKTVGAEPLKFICLTMETQE
jgi:quercetin dioxygenase-like cupin family protein